MEHPEIENRLRAMGTAPLPEHLTERPVGVVAPVATVPTGRRLGRRPLAAAAAALAVTATGGLAWAASGSSGPMVATAPPEQAPPALVADVVPTDVELPDPRPVPVPPGDADASGESTAGGASEGADDGNDADDGALDVAPEYPHLDDPCKGPPAFVTDPTDDPDVTRAEEAAEHARVRSQECPATRDDDTDTGDPDDTDTGDEGTGTGDEGTGDETDEDVAGRSGKADAGRPDHAPGPPADAGRPDHAPGPPADAGRPDHAPGPPADAGRPDHAPGPPADAGRPDHAPGPPSGRPVGRPAGDD